jgi:hypothetical protein
MPIRILFNGREYGDPAEMPDDVRRDYEQALTQFEDANRNGIPDVLENAGKNIVAIHQSSFSINGKTFDDLGDLPPWARRLYEQATGSALPGRPGAELPRAQSAEPAQPAALGSMFDETAHELNLTETIDPLAATRNTLTTIVRVLLVASVIAIVVIASMMFVNIDEGSKSQGGRFYVVAGALLLLGVIIDRYIKTSKR